jgi:hypothetical protein
MEGLMGAAFWVKRFLTVLMIVGIVVCAAQWLRGHDFAYAAIQGALWGPIAAAVFTIARIYQSRRGQHCAICKDTPEMREQGFDENAV